MRKLLAFLVLLIPVYSIEAMVRTGVEVGIGPDEEVIEEVWVRTRVLLWILVR